MLLRSVLVCDGPHQVEPGLASGADAVLVRSVVGDATDLLGMYARRADRPLVFRHAGVLGPERLDAASMTGIDGVVLENAVGARDVQHLAAKLAVVEAEGNLPDGAIRILACTADTPAGILALPSLPAASPRLAGLVWRPGPLASSLGVNAAQASSPLAFARMQLLLAAAACGVPALDEGRAGGRAALDASRKEGFGGCVIDSPDLVDLAREVYSRRSAGTGR